MEWMSIVLAVVSIGLVYLIYKSKTQGKDNVVEQQRKRLKPFPKGDLTLEELRKYDGHNEDGRVLLAIHGEIYDCTAGSRFYGPDGPYASLAGHDATRALGTFNIDGVKDEWDDYSDLTLQNMNTVLEWREQFKEKYDYVGKLVRTQEEKSTLVDEETEDNKTKKKD